jgi:hypothetical protein
MQKNATASAAHGLRADGRISVDPGGGAPPAKRIPVLEGWTPLIVRD